MQDVDVVAVLGLWGGIRRRGSDEVAAATGWWQWDAYRLGLAPDPVDEALSLIPWAEPSGGAVVEFPAGVPATHVVAGLGGTEADGARLVDIVCVVDAAALLPTLREGGAAAQLLVAQLEFSTSVRLVGLEGLSPGVRGQVSGVLAAIAPDARVETGPAMEASPAADACSEARRSYSERRPEPGWVRLLNGEVSLAPGGRPGSAGRDLAGVSAWRYERARPFHSQRLWDALHGEFGPAGDGWLVRSAGFASLAGRGDTVARWDQIGGCLSLSPLPPTPPGEELLAIGQDLGIITADLERETVEELLDAALLSDEEFLAGPTAWEGLLDPFPAWDPVPRTQD